MTQRIALVQNAGRIQQLQPGDVVVNGLELGRRNIILNSNFDILQVAANSQSTVGFANMRVVDMWDLKITSVAGVISATATNVGFVPTIAQSGTYSARSLEFSVTNGTSTIAAGDLAYIITRIEGYNWRPLAQRSTTLSFWVNSTLAGTYCVALRNSGQDRSYVAEYTINSINTWEKKTIKIPASPSAGTWVYDNTGVGIDVIFTLMSGTTWRATPGSWVSANAFSTANQVNWIATAGNFINLSQVQLEQGDTASTFEVIPWDADLANCQRYYSKTAPFGTPTGTGGGTSGALAYRTTVAGVHSQNLTWVYPRIMRVAPTMTYYNPGANNSNWRSVTRVADSGASSSDLIQEHSVVINNLQVSADAVGNEIAIHAQADARLAFAA